MHPPKPQKVKPDNSHPLYKHPAVVAAVIAAAASLFIWWLTNNQHNDESVNYRVTVTESSVIGKAVPAARVKLTLAPTKVRTAPLIQATDTEGIAVFSLPRESLNTRGSVDVVATNYQTQTQTVDIWSGNSSLAILLTPLPPTSTLPATPLHLEPYTRTTTLGPVPSGSGSGKIEYTIESEPPREGYKITSASYSLQGDRGPCGNWSWCWWKQKDETRAIFAFQLQGHTEWASPGVSLTAGTITVNYGPK